MGHWEQTTAANARHRARQARKSGARLRIERAVTGAVIALTALAYWALALVQLWRMWP